MWVKLWFVVYAASWRHEMSAFIFEPSNFTCFTQIECKIFNSFPDSTTIDCFLRNGLIVRVVPVGSIPTMTSLFPVSHKSFNMVLPQSRWKHLLITNLGRDSAS
jgi:hypothetical protein